MTNDGFKAIVALVAVMLALSILGVSDAEAKNSRSKVDSAKEAGQVDVKEGEVPKLVFTFDAKDLDENIATDVAKRSVSLPEGNAFVEGRVTCLRMRDGNALVKGRTDKISDGELDLEGLFVEFHGVESGGAKGKRDELGLDISTDSSACGDLTGASTEPILKGSMIVRDTPNL